jgi:hypothetical protein
MNAPRRRARNIAWRICAAMVFFVASGVLAQTVHKQIDAAGHITYSDRPDTTPLPPTVPALDVANALASNSAISSRRAATIDAHEAARRLGQAELERKQGAERLPGEQAHGTDASVANHRYRQRQEELRRAVVQAQRRSDATDRSLRAPL